MDVLIIGGGVCGSLTGMLLAKDGHTVTIVERDAAEPPADPEAAWNDWDRRSVRQFHMGHLFLPRFRTVLLRELPEVVDALRKQGALEVNIVEGIPDEMSGGAQDGDERFTYISGRRPMVEATIARSAQAAGVTYRRGLAADRLLLDPDRTGHVRGLVTSTNEEFTADLVIDASGRNSALPRLLDDAGLAIPEDHKEDSGFAYYGRTFKSEDGSLPFSFGGGLQHYGSISTLTLAADAGHWFCGFVVSAEDKPMRKLKDNDTFERVWRSLPLVAHWHDGTPITDVEIMAGIQDRVRNFVVDGEPVASGLVAVGDAWACTNPSVGRGASIGLLHSVALRDHIRDGDPSDAVGFVRQWHEITERVVRPWFDDTVTSDRHRLGQIQAEIEGGAHPAEDESLRTFDSITTAMTKDPELLRPFLDTFLLYRTRTEVCAPALIDRVDQLTPDGPDAPLCPTRAEYLSLLEPAH